LIPCPESIIAFPEKKLSFVRLLPAVYIEYVLIHLLLQKCTNLIGVLVKEIMYYVDLLCNSKCLTSNTDLQLLINKTNLCKSLVIFNMLYNLKIRLQLKKLNKYYI